MNVKKSPAPLAETTISKASVFGSYTMTAFTSLTLLLLAIIGLLVNQPLLIPPIAATAAYIFGMPTIPGTQPRSVIGGHLIAGAIGIIIVLILGSSMWAAALAAGIAMFAMNIAKLFHIPSVATAAFVVLSNPSDKVLFMVTLIGASIFLSLMGYAISRFTKKLQYPLYW